MWRVLALLFVLLACLGTGTQASACEDLPVAQGVWILPSSEPIAVYLVGHGLNLAPDAMNDIVEMLRSSGNAVYRITFHGHDGNKRAFENVTSTHWLDDVHAAWCEAKKRYVDKKIGYVGYSLGGLAGSAFVKIKETPVFDNMILIAPALFTRWYTKTLHLISFLRHVDVGIPGRTPKKYRVFRFTPLQAYHALSGLLDVFHREPKFKLDDMPATCVFFHDDDELVSSSALKRYFSNSDNVTLHEIKADLDISHLLVVKNEYQQNDWRKFEQRFYECLK